MNLTLDFDKTVTKILSVSHKELKRREKEWKEQRKQKRKTGKRKDTNG